MEYTFKVGTEPVKWFYKKFSALSDSSIFAVWGGTAVNVSVLRGEGDKTLDFFPLQVEYLERLYAAGKIAASPYVKREGHPADSAILKARIIDRAIRPRFPEGLVDTVQIFINVLSYDPEFDPLILGFNTTVAALMASSIEFDGPLAGVRVSIDENGELYINNKSVPLWDAEGENVIDKEAMNLFLGVEPKGIVMFDAVMREIPEKIVKDAMRFAIDKAKVWFDAQQEFAKEFGVEKQEGTKVVVPADLIDKLEERYGKRLYEALSNPDKEERVKQLEELEETIKEEMVSEQAEQEEDTSEFEALLKRAIAKIFKKYVRKSVLEENRRIDGRDFDQIRPLEIEVGLLPRAHGSANFKRGPTQVLSVVTLDSLQKQLQLEELSGDEEKRYMHEYYAPPYAYGEPGRIRYYPGRREVGHGALAEKALLAVLPSKDEFPYTIRVVSEVMGSGGSTSMASTCGSSLALMDAGVPIKKPVAGISIGVIMDDETGEFKLLTDIQEQEDFYGEMDFKVAGTEDGITAIQMDQKKGVLPVEVFDQALEAAKKARLFILEKMKQVIPKPRSELSPYAPGVAKMKIDPDDIGRLIGPGGKIIKEIMKESGAEIYIEEDGEVIITAVNKASLDKAKELIKDALETEHKLKPAKKTYKIGEVYDVEVVDLKPFGAIVKLLDGTDTLGMIHISEISDMYIKDIHTVLKIGQRVRAKIIEIDEKGRLRLSMKQV